MASKLLALVFLVAGLVAAFIEVITAPGLPTLQDLGMTTEDLYNMTTTFLIPRDGDVQSAAPHCQHYSNADDAQVNDVIAAFNYLMSVGNHPCRANPQTTFVMVGTALIGGAFQDGSPGPADVTASCHDVALQVQWLFTNCNTNGRVGGWQQVSGVYMNVGVANVCNFRGGACN